jgi:hypothetical protein
MFQSKYYKEDNESASNGISSAGITIAIIVLVVAILFWGLGTLGHAVG